MMKTKRRYVAKVVRDPYPTNPREFAISHMVCFHREYKLGDPHDYKPSEFRGWDDVRDRICSDAEEVGDRVVLIEPLYLYEHSGLFLKIGPWDGLLPQGHAEFDSMQVGWVYVLESEIRRKFKTKDEKEILARAREVIEREVDEYGAFLMGLVYQVFMVNKQTSEVDTMFCNVYTKEELDRVVEEYGKEQNAEIVVELVEE